MKRSIVLIAISILVGTIWGLYSFRSIIPFVFLLFDFLILYLILKIVLKKINNKILNNEIYKLKRIIKTIIKKQINKPTILMCFILIILGATYLKTYQSYFENALTYLKTNNCTLEIISQEKEENKKYTYICKVQGKYKGIYILLESNAKYTKQTQITGKFIFDEYEKNKNENLFNPKIYYYSRNIIAKTSISKAQDVKTIKVGKQDKTEDDISNNLSKTQKQIFNSLVFGNSISNENLKDSIQKLSISHLLSISGAHLIILITIISKIFSNILIKIQLKILNKRKKEKQKELKKQKEINKNIKKEIKIYDQNKITNYFQIAFLVFYMFFIQLKVSIVRSSFYLIIVICAKLFQRSNDRINSFFLSLIINILINPFRVFTSSFIFSYLGVISIYFNLEYINKIFVYFKFSNIFKIKKLEKKKIKQKAKKEIIRKRKKEEEKNKEKEKEKKNKDDAKNIQIYKQKEKEKQKEKQKIKNKQKELIKQITKNIKKYLINSIKIFLVVYSYVLIYSIYLNNYFNPYSLITNIIYSNLVMYLYILNNVGFIILKLPNVFNLHNLIYFILNNINKLFEVSVCFLSNYLYFPIYIKNIQIYSVLKYFILFELIKVIFLSVFKLYRFNKDIINDYDNKQKVRHLFKEDKKIIQKVNRNVLFNHIENIFYLVKFLSNQKLRDIKKEKKKRKIKRKKKANEIKIKKLKDNQKEKPKQKQNLKIQLKNFLRKIIIIYLIINILTFNLLEKIILFSQYSNFNMYFIDVNQGDCSYIRYANKNILIDGGGSLTYDISKNVLIPFFLKKNVCIFDYVFVSHVDNDHVLGILGVLEHFDVKNIVLGLQFEENDNLSYLLNIANAKDINVIYFKAGYKLCIKDLNICCFNPDENKIEQNSINNNCLVLMFEIYGRKILFTGDIEKQAENKLLKYDLKADILKVAHHGSSSSSTNEFLSLVNPIFCIICVGKNNVYGHPSKDVLDRLNEFNIKVYRTDINGQINVGINKRGKIRIKTMLR